MVRSLNTLLPDETAEMITKKCKTTGEKITIRRQNPDGKLSNWLHIAMDKRLWEWYIYKLTHPNSLIPPRPNPTRPRNQQRSRTNDEEPEDTNTRRNNDRRHNRQRQDNSSNQYARENERRNPDGANAPEPTQNHSRTNYNIQNVGRTRIDSLRALGLEEHATITDIKRRFRTLSLIYHPDKYNESLGISKELATTHFQLLNNAYDKLKETQ